MVHMPTREIAIESNVFACIQLTAITIPQTSIMNAIPKARLNRTFPIRQARAARQIATAPND